MNFNNYYIFIDVLRFMKKSFIDGSSISLVWVINNLLMGHQ